MIVLSKKNFLIRGDKDVSFFLQKDVLTSDLPEWVAEHWYFQKLCACGEITVSESHKDTEIEKAIVESEVKAAVAEKKAEAPKKKRSAKKKAEE